MSVKITYFVHGTTTDNEQHISSGWKDVALSETGIKQGKELKELTKEKRFDVVFCSDLQRASESAKLAWEGMYTIVPDARLRECNYGDLNGSPKSVVEPVRLQSMHTRFPNGESYDDVKVRIADFLDMIKRDYDGKHVAIVAHQAPQLALDVLLKGMSWDEVLVHDWRNTHAWQPGWEFVLE
jgi:broad specificity phosphatase PhoE